MAWPIYSTVRMSHVSSCVIEGTFRNRLVPPLQGDPCSYTPDFPTVSSVLICGQRN